MAEAVMRADLSSTLSLDAYVAAYVRAAIKRTLSTDDLPPIPAQVRKRAQVEILLSLLSPRAQAVLHLRYGLSDDNERKHTTNEIAGLLGLDRRVVLTIERDALTRLRAFVAGEATLGQQNGKPCICYPAAHNTATLPPEQEAALMATCRDLSAQGVIVTGRALSKVANISLERALTFLRLHRTGTPTEDRARQRQQKLERVCARLEAQEARIRSQRLSQEAGVAKQTAIDFLTIRRRTHHATV